MSYQERLEHLEQRVAALEAHVARLQAKPAWPSPQLVLTTSHPVTLPRYTCQVCGAYGCQKPHTTNATAVGT